MVTALITGISGQDGALLARFLLERNYRVVGTSRNAESASFDNLRTLGIADRIELQSMSPADFRGTIQTLERVGPDEVYHLAAQSSVGLSFDRPVETVESIGIGTLNVLEAIRALRRGIKLFNASSGESFGDTGATPATEQTPFQPRSPYGIAKAAAHWAVVNYRQSFGLYAANGILFNHELPLRPTRFVTKKIIAGACRIKAGTTDNLDLGTLQIRRDWGWAPEYVDAMWRILQQPEPDDYVVATGVSHSLEDFVDVAFRSLGLDWRRHVRLRNEQMRPSDILCSRGDPGKALSKLGWKATSVMPEVVASMLKSELAQLQSSGQDAAHQRPVSVA